MWAIPADAKKTITQIVAMSDNELLVSTKEGSVMVLDAKGNEIKNLRTASHSGVTDMAVMSGSNAMVALLDGNGEVCRVSLRFS